MAIKKYEDVKQYEMLGKIRLGIKKDGKPRSVDYFVCPPEIKSVLGDKPKELEVMFFSENVNAVLSYFYKRFANGKLLCFSDGINARQLKKGDNGKYDYVDIECDIEKCEYYKKKQCAMVLELKFILPSVNPSGYYQIDTKSIQSLLNLKSSLELMDKVDGGIAWKPMILSTKLEKTKSGVAPRLHLRMKTDKSECNKNLDTETSITRESMEDKNCKEKLEKIWKEVVYSSGIKVSQLKVNVFMISLYNLTHKGEEVPNKNDLTDEQCEKFYKQIKTNKDGVVEWLKKQVK